MNETITRETLTLTMFPADLVDAGMAVGAGLVFGAAVAAGLLFVGWALINFAWDAVAAAWRWAASKRTAAP